MAARPFHYRALSGVASVVVGAITLLDMAAGPVVRPFARLIEESSPIALVRRLARRLPAYAALAALLVPLAVAEPAKVFAVYLIGEEHWISGITTLAAAYFVSLVLVDTIYDGARPQLRSIAWFAALVDRITAVRLAVTSAIRASRAYQSTRAIAMRMRGWVKRRVREGLVRTDKSSPDRGA